METLEGVCSMGRNYRQDRWIRSKNHISQLIHDMKQKGHQPGSWFDRRPDLRLSSGHFKIRGLCLVSMSICRCGKQQGGVNNSTKPQANSPE